MMRIKFDVNIYKHILFAVFMVAGTVVLLQYLRLSSLQLLRTSFLPYLLLIEAIAMFSLAALVYIVFIPAPKRRPRAEVAPKIRFVSSPVMAPIVNPMVKWVERDMAISGIYESPLVYISTYIVVSLVSLAILAPVSIYVALTFHPLGFLLLLIPLTIPLLLKFQLILKKNERKEYTSDELPFFVAHAMIYQAVGKTIVDALMTASQKKMFNYISKDGEFIHRLIATGKDDITAITTLAKTHPNQDFQTFLQGYTSIVRSGGDLVRYMETKLKDLIEKMKFRFEKYVNDATTMAESTLMILLVFPLILLAGSFILPSESVNLINVLSLFIIPVLMALIFVVVSMAQPRTYDKVVPIPLTSILSAVIVFLIMEFLLPMTGIIQLSRHANLSMAIAVGAFINGVVVRRQMKEISEIEKYLPQFLRDIVEYRKMGYDMVTAINYAAREGRYGKKLTQHVNYLITNLQLGRSMDSIIKDLGVKSMMERIVLELLGAAVEEGEIKPSEVEHIIDFIMTLNRTKEETRSKLKIITMIGFLAPLILIFMSQLMVALTGYMMPFMSSVGAGGGSTPFSIGAAFDPALIESLAEANNTLIVIASMGIGILTGKIVGFTAKNTMPLAITMTVAFIGLIFGEILINNMLSTVLGEATEGFTAFQSIIPPLFKHISMI